MSIPEGSFYTGFIRRTIDWFTGRYDEHNYGHVRHGVSTDGREFQAHVNPSTNEAQVFHFRPGPFKTEHVPPWFYKLQRDSGGVWRIRLEPQNSFFGPRVKVFVERPETDH